MLEKSIGKGEHLSRMKVVNWFDTFIVSILDLISYDTYVVGLLEEGHQ